MFYLFSRFCFCLHQPVAGHCYNLVCLLLRFNFLMPNEPFKLSCLIFFNFMDVIFILGHTNLTFQIISNFRGLISTFVLFYLSLIYLSCIHFYINFNFWCKQCRPWLDIVFSGIWSGPIYNVLLTCSGTPSIDRFNYFTLWVAILEYF